MPKSRTRKGRKSYRPKGTGRFGIPNPADLFLLIGQGGLDPDEEEFAAKMLYAEMEKNPEGAPVLQEMFGDAWPPVSPQALIRLARQAAQTLTPGDTDADSNNSEEARTNQ